MRALAIVSLVLIAACSCAQEAKVELAERSFTITSPRLQVTVEDTWGGDIVSATSAHIAASTKERALLSVSFMNDWTNEHVAGYQRIKKRF